MSTIWSDQLLDESTVKGLETRRWARETLERLGKTARGKRENRSSGQETPPRGIVAAPKRTVPPDSEVLGSLTVNARVMRVQTSADERLEAEARVREMLG